MAKNKNPQNDEMQNDSPNSPKEKGTGLVCDTKAQCAWMPLDLDDIKVLGLNPNTVRAGEVISRARENLGLPAQQKASRGLISSVKAELEAKGVYLGEDAKTSDVIKAMQELLRKSGAM